MVSLKLVSGFGKSLELFGGDIFHHHFYRFDIMTTIVFTKWFREQFTGQLVVLTK